MLIFSPAALSFILRSCILSLEFFRNLHQHWITKSLNKRSFVYPPMVKEDAQMLLKMRGYQKRSNLIDARFGFCGLMLTYFRLFRISFKLFNLSYIKVFACGAKITRTHFLLSCLLLLPTLEFLGPLSANWSLMESKVRPAAQRFKNY